jgi:hypothetical protein
MKKMEFFNNIYEFCSCVSSRKPNKVFEGRELSSNTGSYDFCHTNNYRESEELLKHGYEISIKYNNPSSLELGLSNKRNQRIGFEGIIPHIPNFVANLPNSMIHFDNTPMKAKVIHIVYNNEYHADINSEDVIDTNSKLLSIIENMELNGYRVSLSLVYYYCKDGDVFGYEVIIKEANQPFNKLKISYPLVHPSFFRRQGFRWLETMPDLENKEYAYGYGYGIIRKYDSKDSLYLKKRLKEDKLLGAHNENKVFLQYNHLSKLSDKEILDVIKKQIENK